MFSFMDIIGSYEQRKVNNFKKGALEIDTVAVNDSLQPYETAVKCPSFNDNNWVIVEMYDNKRKAIEGHNRWVKKLSKKLPSKLKDVSTSTIKLLTGVGDTTYERKK